MSGGDAPLASFFSAPGVMVDCVEFLENYSDFRDGYLPQARREAFESHVKGCDSCARYDRVVGGGVQVFRSLPELSPSSDFQSRLLRRLHAVDLVASRQASGASMAVTFMICLALGLGAWVPVLRGTDEPVRLPPIVAHAPYHDLSPLLLQAAPSVVGVRSALQLQPAFAGPGLLLDRSVSAATLAYRPVSTFYPQR